MKIGAFANRHGVSIDTLRHYMDLKLLLPVKEGAHYQFDGRCDEDMRQVIELKELGFSLAEIKSILSFMRIGKMTDFQQNAFYQNIFLERLTRVDEEIRLGEQHRERLKTRIKAMKRQPEREELKLGIPLEGLAVLACNQCGGDLSLTEGQVIDNELYEGTLQCSCGQTYQVVEGMLHSPGNTEHQVSYNYIERISDYITATPEAYIDRLYTSIEWGIKTFREIDQRHRVALDLGSGVGMFLRNVHELMDPSLLYIVVDHNLHLHRFLKRMMERAPVKRKLMFIVSDFTDLPLRKGAVNLLIDVAGSSNYAFEHDDFLLKTIDPVLARDVELMSGMIVFDRFAPESQIPPQRRGLFSQKPIIGALADLGYRIMTTRETESVEEGGIYEDFFVPGERVHTLLMRAKRWG